MLKLKQKFKDASTIKELNVLWQDYMGIPVPNAQSAEMNLVEDDEYTPLPVTPGLKF